MLSDVANKMVREVALNEEAEGLVTHNVKDFLPALRSDVTIITMQGEIVRRLRT